MTELEERYGALLREWLLSFYSLESGEVKSVTDLVERTEDALIETALAHPSTPQPKGGRVRLRIFDLATPWFWLVIFWQRAYSQPWLQASLYPPPKWCRGWLNVWQWERTPDPNQQYAQVDEP